MSWRVKQKLPQCYYSNVLVWPRSDLLSRLGNSITAVKIWHRILETKQVVNNGVIVEELEQIFARLESNNRGNNSRISWNVWVVLARSPNQESISLLGHTSKLTIVIFLLCKSESTISPAWLGVCMAAQVTVSSAVWLEYFERSAICCAQYDAFFSLVRFGQAALFFTVTIFRVSHSLLWLTCAKQTTLLSPPNRINKLWLKETQARMAPIDRIERLVGQLDNGVAGLERLVGQLPSWSWE